MLEDMVEFFTIQTLYIALYYFVRNFFPFTITTP